MLNNGALDTRNNHHNKFLTWLMTSRCISINTGTFLS